jgi:hypothetical protein
VELHKVECERGGGRRKARGLRYSVHEGVCKECRGTGSNPAAMEW